MKKIVLFIFVLLLSVSIVQAATVQGTVYDLSLNKVNNVKLTIDTVPAQTYIAPYGFYTFDLIPGEYTLRAEYYEDQVLILEAEESVKIDKDGEFRIDLVLFPVLEEEVEDIELPETTLEQESYWFYYILFLFLIGVLLLRYKKLKPKKNKEVKVIKIDPELKKIIDLLKEHNGRITQLDIRKKYPSLSEAKISLMITELEHKGLVRKIKKGRGNVIIRK